MSKEVENFFKNIGFDFLTDYFADHVNLTMKELRAMSDDQLELILEGSMYVKMLRDELNRYKMKD